MGTIASPWHYDGVPYCALGFFKVTTSRDPALRLTLRTCYSATVQATRRRFDVDPFATERAESVKPEARTIRMTVPNSGLPVSPRPLRHGNRPKGRRGSRVREEDAKDAAL
jgi:hypothetical protein